MWWPAVVQAEWEMAVASAGHHMGIRGCKYSLELLMMSGVPLETCWAFNKLWNNKFYYKAASCWCFYWVIYDAWISKVCGNCVPFTTDISSVSVQRQCVLLRDILETHFYVPVESNCRPVGQHAVCVYSVRTFGSFDRFSSNVCACFTVVGFSH